MPRRRVQTSATDLAPGAFIVVTVDQQCRIRLSKEIGLVVPWLKEASGALACRVSVGAAGGAQIATEDCWKSQFRAVAGRLKGKPARGPDAGAPWMNYVRFLASTWPLAIRAEESRFSITLPEEPRKLALLPGANERAVVFAIGAVLELWKADEWLQRARSVAGNLEVQYEQAVEALGERAEA